MAFRHGSFPFDDDGAWCRWMIGRRGDGGRDEELLVQLDGRGRWGGRLTWLGRSKHHFGWGFTFGRNGMESDVGLDVHAGRWAHLWLRFRAPWLKRLRIEQGNPDWYVARHTSLKVKPHGGCYLSWEIDHTAGHSRSSDPWWRDGTLGHRQVFGRVVHERAVVETATPRLKLPEGHYQAAAVRERLTQRHQRWPGTWLDRVRPHEPVESWSIDVEPGGIPVEGKGENSWDCGMDGTFGIFGLEGPTLGEACDEFVAHVLHDRQRRGGPHNLPRPMSITEAEQWVREQRR